MFRLIGRIVINFVIAYVAGVFAAVVVTQSQSLTNRKAHYSE